MARGDVRQVEEGDADGPPRPSLPGLDTARRPEDPGGGSPRASPIDTLDALVVAWSAAAPERVGEIAFLPADDAVRVLGRGGPLPREAEERLRLFRHGPHGPEERPELEGASLSRRQLLVTAADGRLHVARIGRRPLRVDGVRADSAFTLPGSTLHLEHELMLLHVRRPLTMAGLRHRGRPTHPFGEPDADGLVGESPALWRLRDDIATASQLDRHVLVVGPSGAGKELVARAIHRRSARAGRALVSRSAATLPGGILDAELFGNARNYPNPGMPERPGLVGEADGSTLFLDEIGEMPHDHQAHLLRVLDGDGEYQRLGEAKVRRARFRLIAATNRPPGALKRDVLARFPMVITVPPLAERREDVPLLARHLVGTAARRDPALFGRFLDGDSERATARLGEDLVEALLRVDFPLEVRELEAMLLRAMVRSPGDRVVASDELLSAAVAAPAERDHARIEARALDREDVERALARNDGRMEPTARELGLRSRFQLYRLLKRWQAEDP